MKFAHLIILLILMGIAGGAAYIWYNNRASAADTVFRTATVRRGDLAVITTATGAVQAEEVIDVGAQVAGRIVAFGTDAAGKPIDYRSEVKTGMTLAKIDESVYQTEVEQANAQLAQANAKLVEARAGIDRANADVNQLRAKLVQAESDWNRAQKLGPSEALARSTYDAYNAAYLTARANVEVGGAAINQAKASEASALAAVSAATAVQKRALQNLAYCTIKSPVDGVIIDRRVGIGQTVVASLNAPSLFLLAKDLSRMQVLFAVNEADIGTIFPGQKVTFTVDARGGELFDGVVNKVRLNANFTQNVVTYTVEVTADNSGGKLLPYLTANGKFEVTRREGALMVPNAALRFTPSKPEDVVPEARDQIGKGAERGGRPDGSRRGPQGGPASQASSRPSTGPASAPSMRPGTVWVRDGKLLRPVRVMTGISDGTLTEIKSRDLAEGAQIIVGEVKPASVAGGSGSPFAPQMRGGGRGPGGGAGGSGSGGGR